MAIKLVTEVMDWAPATLTHREHKVLITLAENAWLATREIWDSVESPRMLRRAQLTERQMYEVIAALIRKKCLEKPVWGGRNHRAKYRIARLAVPRGSAAYEAMLAKLSPGERQALVYADWWPDPDHDQHAEKPQPDSLLVLVGVKLGWKVQTIDRLSASRLRSSVDPPKAELNVTELLRRTRYASTTARTRMVPGDQQSPDEVHLQSPAADRNARGRAWETARLSGGNRPRLSDV
jgi:hypothetical protein